MTQKRANSEPPAQDASSELRRTSVPSIAVAAMVLLVAILFVVRALTHEGGTNASADDGPDFTDYQTDPNRPGELIFNSDPFEKAKPHIVLRSPLTESFKPKAKGREARFRNVAALARPSSNAGPSGSSVASTPALPKPTTGIPKNNTGGRKYASDPPPKQPTPVLRVVSVPSGIPVTVNGSPAGTTPIARRVPITESSWTIAIRAVGYAPFEQEARPGPDGDYFVRAVMKRIGQDSAPMEATATITEAAYRELKRTN
ncbi:MAG: PEGA domain-containing protein [Deltaproteobacteria bacterium]|nr:PEGA domain-containing protein [Deltaproteobacteria bacterium]